jgi:hypothetical protein
MPLMSSTAILRAYVFLAALMGVPSSALADTSIRIAFVETHDRKPPDERLGIVRSHEIDATLSGNHVSENSQSVGGGRKHRNVKYGSNSEALGDEKAAVTWRVVGPHALRRFLAGRQFLQVIDVSVRSDGGCDATVRYLLQKGYDDIISRRADNGELAHFTLPTVTSTECKIN